MGKNKSKKKATGNGNGTNSNENGHVEPVVKTEGEQVRPEGEESLDDNDDEGAEVIESGTETQVVANNIESTVEDKDLIINQLQKEIAELKLSKVNMDSASEPPKSSSEDEIEKLKKLLEEKNKENEQSQVNYQNLLSRLSGMKALFAKMKQAETDLEVAELEKSKLKETVEQTEGEKKVLIRTIKDLKEEISSLNSECEGLTERVSKLTQENSKFEDELEKLHTTKKQLQGQVTELKNNQEESLIMMNEEKLVRQNLSNEILDLKQMLLYKDNEINIQLQDKASLNSKLLKLEENFMRKTSEFDIQASQHANELKNLNNSLQEKDSVIKGLQEKVENYEKELVKIEKLEKEVKEKQLQIGKLRHELIILNDHLTKALKLIKKDNNSETVDKQLVSNLFVSFLNLPRGDSRKFQALELIANFLNWDREMRVHAGIENKTKGEESNRSRQSFVSLWTEYLEKESIREHNQNAANPSNEK